MTQKKANLAASVATRLLNRAKQAGDDYLVVLTGYCFERFLYRLGVSALRDQFVLKGAMLLRVWSDRPYRATRDLDLLRIGNASFDAIREDIRTVCATEVEPDAVVFDADGVKIDAIRAEDEYAGTRVALPARCGSARLSLQIDMGVGDPVWPPPQLCRYPVLLDSPVPEVLAYPREAVVAEKLEAVIVFGDRNSRIKDLFDLHHLATRFEFDRKTLSEAVRRTLGRRRTPIPAETPIGLTPQYWENPSRPSQMRAFVKRARLEAEIPGPEFSRLLGEFLLPILDDQRGQAKARGTWRPGGPWR